MTYYTHTESPLGTLLLTSDGVHLTGLYMQPHTGMPVADGTWTEDATAAPLPETVRQLTEFFQGQRLAFDLPLAGQGTEFQRSVWAGLLEIPFGETRSYGQMARALGNPNACRAVGLANGRNPISIIVPCHRVIGASGKLVGYGGGLPRKTALLEWEQRVLREGPYPMPQCG